MTAACVSCHLNTKTVPSMFLQQPVVVAVERVIAHDWAACVKRPGEVCGCCVFAALLCWFTRERSGSSSVPGAQPLCLRARSGKHMSQANFYRCRCAPTCIRTRYTVPFFVPFVALASRCLKPSVYCPMHRFPRYSNVAKTKPAKYL